MSIHRGPMVCKITWKNNKILIKKFNKKEEEEKKS